MAVRKTKKVIPFEFVLEELAPLSPMTKPMFGCYSVYVGDRIVFILRDRPTSPNDNGVWLATTSEHHASLQRDFPQMRSIEMFDDGGPGLTGWQVLPLDSEDFESAVMLACEFVRKGDPRIGKVPKSRLKSKKKKTPQKRKKKP